MEQCQSSGVGEVQSASQPGVRMKLIDSDRRSLEFWCCLPGSTRFSTFGFFRFSFFPSFISFEVKIGFTSHLCGNDTSMALASGCFRMVHENILLNSSGGKQHNNFPLQKILFPSNPFRCFFCAVQPGSTLTQQDKF